MSSAAQELQSLVDSHTNDPASSSASACASHMASYGVAADKLLNSLSGMCPGLDTCMRGMGQEGQADMVQDVDGMRAEIAAHVANGCAAPDLPAEMTRHRGAMDTYTHGLMTRTDYITGMMMNRGMMHWNGCQ